MQHVERRQVGVTAEAAERMGRTATESTRVGFATKGRLGGLPPLRALFYQSIHLA